MSSKAPTAALILLLLLGACDNGVSEGEPVLAITAADVAITVQEGDAAPGQSTLVRNSGEGVLRWSAAAGVPWLAVTPASGSLKAGQSAAITVAASTGGLAPGTHTRAITFSAAGAEPRSVAVTVTVMPAPALSVDSASFTFTAEEGTDPPVRTAAVTNTGGGTLAWTALDSLSWLAVGSAGGSLAAGQSASLALSVSTAGLAPGTYAGTVTVAAPGARNGLRSITVTLVVTPAPALEVGPAALSFTAEEDAAAGGQALAIRNTGGGTLRWTATEAMTWLVGSPGSGTLGAGESTGLNLSVTAAGLAPGTYTGTITVSAPGAHAAPQDVAVTLVVTPAPVLEVGPASLSFTAQEETAAAGQALTIRNAGGGTLGWTATEPIPWLVGSPGSGSLSAGESTSLNLSVNAAGLAPGTYTGTITVSAPGARTAPREVGVTLVVTTAPVLEVGPATLSFTAQEGTAAAAQTLTIRNTGGGTLAWTATEPLPWLVGSPGSGSLGAGESASLSLAVNTDGLARGSYTGTITITAPGAAGSPREIPVTLVVAAPPILGLRPTALSFTAAQETNPAAQAVTISNGGGGSMSYAAAEAIPWLVGSPAHGTLGAGESAPLNLSVNTAGLAPGVYTGTLSVTAPGAALSPQTADVTLTVTPGPVLSVNPASLAVTLEQGTQGTKTVEITNTGTGTLTWSASEPIPWLVGWPAGGTLGAGKSWNLQLSFSAEGLPPGSYDGTITVSAPGAGPSPLQIPVTLAVVAPPTTPRLGVSPGSVSFVALQGTSPAIQTLTIGNTGGGTLAWSASASTPWLKLSPTSGTVAAGQAVTVSVSADSLGLVAGAYAETITISAPGAAGAPKNVAVFRIVQAPPPPPPTPPTDRPVLMLSHWILYFGSRANGANPPPRSVTITNIGSLPFSWTAISPYPWLTISPASGTLDAGQRIVMSLSVDAAGMPKESPGGGWDPIVIRAPAAGGSYGLPFWFGESLPRQPVLESPTDGAIGVSVTPSFRWAAAEDALHYVVVVATAPAVLPLHPDDSSCNLCVIDAKAVETSFVVPQGELKPNTRYFWMVRSIWFNDIEDSPPVFRANSEIRMFTTGPAPP